MTDNEIIKALEWLERLKRDTDVSEWAESLKIILNEYNRQKEEIERLNIELQSMRSVANSYKMHYETAKSEAIKEFSNEFIKTLKDALYGLDIKEKTISKEEVQKRFELLMHKDIPEVIEYVKNKMVGDEK